MFFERINYNPLKIDREIVSIQIHEKFIQIKVFPRKLKETLKNWKSQRNFSATTKKRINGVGGGEGLYINTHQNQEFNPCALLFAPKKNPYALLTASPTARAEKREEVIIIPPPIPFCWYCAALLLLCFSSVALRM